MAERRVKRTSMGIWRRDCVSVNMFSGEGKRSNLRMKERLVMKRMRRAR